MNVVFSITVFAMVFVTATVAFRLLREATRERRLLAERLDSAGASQSDDSIIRRNVLIISPSRWANRSWILRKIEETLVQAGLYVGALRFFLWTAICAAAGLLIGMFAAGALGYAVLAAFGAALLPIVYVRSRRRRRMDAFLQQLPLALDVIKSSLEAGHTLQRAIQVLVGEFEAPLGTEFRLALEQTRLGVPLSKALADLAERMPESDFRLLVVAVRIQSEVGTSLAPIIGRLADLMRARERLRQQVRTFSAQLRLGGVVVALLPVLVLTILGFTEPHYTQTLFHDPAGQMLLKIAIICDLSAFFIVRRMMKLQY